MTISSSLRRAGPYDGNDSATAFPFSFKVFAKTDVLATLTNAAGIESTLVLDSDYTVSLSGDQDSSPGGTVSYPISGAPLPAGYKLTLSGNLPYSQPTDIQNSGGFYPQVIEDALDRVVVQTQQLAEEVSRTVKVNISDPTPPDELFASVLTRAAASADAAEASAAESQNSANDASDSAALAQQWAAQIGTPVDGTDYSAKSNALLSKDWATKTSGTVDGADYSAKYWAQQSQAGAGLPRYNAGSEPTTDAGDIWINGIGACRWDAGDGRYYRIPTYENRVPLRSASGTWTSGAYTKYVRLNGCAGGGGGGSGSATGGTGRSSGGGAGEAVRDYLYTVTPSTPISYTCGAAGAGVGSGTPTTGTNGGNSTFGTLTLVGGSGGLASNSSNIAGGTGGSSATPGAIPGQPGQYAQTNATFGDGGSCIYGQGGRNNNPNGTGAANATGFGAGAGGTFGTNPNTAGAGFWDVYF